MQTAQSMVQAHPSPQVPERPITPIHPHDKRLAYGSLMTTFGTGVVLLLAAARSPVTRYAGDRPSSRVPWKDLLLLGLATQKITRIVAKDRVAEPLRAPFTSDEHGEKARENALRHSLGELITCQYCLAPWVAAGLLGVYLYRPATARLVASLFSIVAVSDSSNRSYSRLANK